MSEWAESRGRVHAEPSIEWYPITAHMRGLFPRMTQGELETFTERNFFMREYCGEHFRCECLHALAAAGCSTDFFASVYNYEPTNRRRESRVVDFELLDNLLCNALRGGNINTVRWLLDRGASIHHLLEAAKVTGGLRLHPVISACGSGSIEILDLVFAGIPPVDNIYYDISYYHIAEGIPRRHLCKLAMQVGHPTVAVWAANCGYAGYNCKHVWRARPSAIAHIKRVAEKKI